jgi:hypothetical protein
MPPIGEQQNRIIGVVGRKGVGKSTFSKEFLLPHIPRLFVYDTMGEHRWIPDTFEEQDKAVIYLMESQQYETFQARYVPEVDDEEKDFSEICNIVYEQGNMCFVIEEVVMMGCSPNFAPPKLRRVTRLGRHRNLDVIYTTQRLEECPRLLTSATDVFVIFSHTEPKSLDRISERCGPEVARKVAAFQGHEFLIFDVIAKKEVSTVDCGSIMIPISSRYMAQPSRAPIPTT